MSYYPPGAFDALVQRDEQVDKYQMTFEQALIDRKQELRTKATVNFTDCMRKNKDYSSAKLVHENLDDDLLSEAIRQWLTGNLDQAAKIFNDACEKALNDAADYLATCDANLGEW